MTLRANLAGPTSIIPVPDCSHRQLHAWFSYIVAITSSFRDHCGRPRIRASHHVISPHLTTRWVRFEKHICKTIVSVPSEPSERSRAYPNWEHFRRAPDSLVPERFMTSWLRFAVFTRNQVPLNHTSDRPRSNVSPRSANPQFRHLSFDLSGAASPSSRLLHIVRSGSAAPSPIRGFRLLSRLVLVCTTGPQHCRFRDVVPGTAIASAAIRALLSVRGSLPRLPFAAVPFGRSGLSARRSNRGLTLRRTTGNFNPTLWRGGGALTYVRWCRLSGTEAWCLEHRRQSGR